MKKKFWIFGVLFIATFIFICVPKVSAYQSIKIDNGFYTCFKFDSIEIAGNDNIRFISDNDNYFAKSGDQYENNNVLVSTTFQTITLYKYYNFSTNELEVEYSHFTLDFEEQNITELFVYSSEVLFNINDTFRIYSDSTLNDYRITFKIKLPDNSFINVSEYKNNLQYFDLSEYIRNNYSQVLEDDRNIIALSDVNISMRPRELGSVYIRQSLYSVNENPDLLTQWLDEYVPHPIIKENVDVSNWIMQIFKTFDRFLAIKFGDVSIGGILLIPLILSIVFVVLRIWRGGSA